MDKAVLGLAVLLAVWAGWLDWRSRRIPNWLTVPALLLGVALNTIVWRLPGTRAGLQGAGLALALLLPFVVLRGLGAGDWKLMGALGAFLAGRLRSEEHTSELQSPYELVWRLLLDKKQQNRLLR